MNTSESGAKDSLLSLLIEQQVLKFGEFTLKSGRVSPYASLLETAAKLPVPDISQLQLKSRPSEFKLLGRFVPGVDNARILTGQPIFASDLRLEGMLYAMYEKSPVFGGKVRGANLEHIRTLPGHHEWNRGLQQRTISGHHAAKCV